MMRVLSAELLDSWRRRESVRYNVGRPVLVAQLVEGMPTLESTLHPNSPRTSIGSNLYTRSPSESRAPSVDPTLVNNLTRR